MASPATTKTTSLIGCGSVVFNGKTYTKATVVTDTIKSTLGCDSILNKVTITISCVPIITSFTPLLAATGDTVTIIGSNFNSTKSVSFGSTNATSFIVVNDSTLKAIVGIGTSGDVSVTNTSGTSVLAGFAYNSANIIKGIQTASPFITAGANVTAGLSYGAGILQVPSAPRGSITFGSARPRGFAADGTTATFDTAVSKNEYVQFAVSPAIGFNMAINGITLKGNGTVASATNNYAIAYAIGDSTLFNSGGATFLDSAGITGNILYRTNDFLVSGADTANQNIVVKNGSTIYLRVYLWGAAARTNASQFTITNFTIIGKVSADASSSITKETICYGSSYLFNGTSYSKAGTYTAHLTNSLGGDSTAVLELKVTAPAAIKALNLIGCGSVSYKGKTYTAATTFIDTVQSSIGCDSLYINVKVTISCSPFITSFTPTTAAISDTVTIIGVNFTGATAVSFGGTAAASFTVVNDTTILAIVGNGSSGTLSITTPKGVVTATGFVYNTANIITGIKNTTPFLAAGKNVVTGLTYGKGILQVPAAARRTITFGSARPRGFSADGVNATFDTANAKGEYVQFAISPAAGYKMDVNGITIKGNGTVASATNNYAIAYAVGDSTLFDNGQATFLDSAGSAGNILYTTADYLASGADTTGLSIKVNNNAKLYLRVYLWGAAARTNTSQFTLSTFTMYGSVVSAATSSTTDTGICAGSSITFNGVTYDSAGTYTAHLTNSQGADSAAHLILSIKKTSTSTTIDSICGNSSYKFNGTVYTKAGTYTAHLTNAVGCDSSATLVLSVITPKTASILIKSSVLSTTGTACAPSLITLDASTTNSGSKPIYQWSINGTTIPVSQQSISYTVTLPGQVLVLCKLISSEACVVADTVSSNTLSINVAATSTATVSISSAINGSTETFTATVTNGGSTPTYSWYKNSVLVSSGDSTYTDSALVTGDSVYCVVASNKTCVVNPTATSNVLLVSNPLPLSLTSFSASSLGTDNLLNWNTANEVSTASFAVQSSKDGASFTDIVSVAAKGASINTYCFTDKSATGITYYRLKMIDKTGKFVYSTVVEAGVKSSNSFAIYPNPVHSVLHLQLSSTKVGAAVVQVVDVLGKVLVIQQISLSIGTNNISVPVASIANGSYRVVLKGDSVQQKQFIKN